MMCVLLPRHYFYALVLLILQLGAIVSSFNPDSYKPLQWSSWIPEQYTLDFDNLPKEPCPGALYWSCICVSNLRKSMYLVACGGYPEIKDFIQAPQNTTHIVVESDDDLYNTLPNGSFDKLTNLVYMELSHTGLETIENHAFACLTNLVVLDLSTNCLETIESHIFEYLTNLMVLDLSENYLHTPALFLRPLLSLQSLDISNQVAKDTFCIQYILNGISELKHLEYLAISINFVSKENVLQLQDTSVTYLYINDMYGIEQDALSSWKALNSLHLKNPHVEVFKNLSGLQAECLYITRLSGPPSSTIDFDRFEAPYLKPLAIRYSEVEYLNFKSFCVHTLQWLDLSGNKLGDFEIDVQKMQQLHYLDLSQLKNEGSTLNPFDNTIYFLNSLIFLNLEYTPFYTSFLDSCLLHLEFVNVRSTGLNRFFYYCSEWNSTTVAIKHLDMRDNYIECVDSSQVVLTGYDWSTLNVLKLSNNRLGSDTSEECRDIEPLHFMDFLKPFWNLTHLYLDTNFMKYDLPHDMLLNQTKLQSLHLSDMYLTNLAADIGHLTDLKFLDLSQNKIQYLYTSTMRDINKIIRYTPNRRNASRILEINLSHNRLSCSCSCLEFYKWMMNVHVRNYITFTDFKSYRCTFDNGQNTNLSDLNLTVDILRSQCLSTDWSPVIRTTTAITVVYMFIPVVTTSFRFRHTFRYLWLKHRMHRLYLERQILDPKYRFDAFVSCDRSDAIWVKRNFLPKLENQQIGLKFCVAQRNFMVGTTIIDNIVQSINQSRKVVFVISQNFLKSGWCKEELLIGHHESLSRGKNILICIFMPDIIYNELSDRLRFILNHVTCIKWPRDPAAQEVFWIMLQRALLDGQANGYEV